MPLRPEPLPDEYGPERAFAAALCTVALQDLANPNEAPHSRAWLQSDEADIFLAAIGIERDTVIERLRRLGVWHYRASALQESC